MAITYETGYWIRNYSLFAFTLTMYNRKLKNNNMVQYGLLYNNNNNKYKTVHSLHVTEQ